MLKIDLATQNQKIIAVGTSWDDQNFDTFPHFRTRTDPAEGAVKYSTSTFFGEEKNSNSNYDEEYELRRKLAFRFSTDLARTLDLEWQGAMAGGGSINRNGGKELLIEKNIRGSNGDPGYNEPFDCESLTPWKKLCVCPEPLIWHYQDLNDYLPGKGATPSPRNCWFKKLEDRFHLGDSSAATLLARFYQNGHNQRISYRHHDSKQEDIKIKCLSPECQKIDKPNFSCISCLSLEEIKRKSLWNWDSTALPLKPIKFWCAQCITDSANNESLKTQKSINHNVEMKWPAWLDLRCEKCTK